MKNVFLLVSFLFLSAPVFSADKDGNFAAKGAARKSCTDFSSAVKLKSTDRLLYAGWLEGYLTSYNQFQKDNYDISPWQTTELLMVLLQRHCQLNPEVKFLNAANSLIMAFFPIRLFSKNTIVQIEVGDSSAYYYEEILLRARKRLMMLGYYKGLDDGGAYDSEDTNAYMAYQKKHGLTVTGMPDQQTLASLFLKKVDPAAKVK